MRCTRINARTQRILIGVTLGLAAVYAYAFYFLVEFFPPPSPTLPQAQIIDLYAHANLQFRIGVVLMILSGGFFIPWSVVIGVQMARDEDGVPMWAITQALASTLGAWLVAFPPVMWGIAAFSVDRAPEVTVLMHEAAWLTFVTPGSFFPFQTFPIAVVALSAYKDEALSAFPRWLGWVTLWAGTFGAIAAMAQLFKTGPFAWNGLFPFYMPIITFGAWMCSATYCLLRAIRRQEQALSVTRAN